MRNIKQITGGVAAAASLLLSAIKKTIFARPGSLRQPMLIIRLLVGGWLIFYLTGCSCAFRCMFDKEPSKKIEKLYGLPDGSLYYASERVSSSSPELRPGPFGSFVSCEDYCKALVEKNPEYMAFLDAVIKEALRVDGGQNQSVTKEEPAEDTIASVGNPLPKKKEPGQIESNTVIKHNSLFPVSGEYLATTITAGPTLSFMSSGGEAGNYFQSKPGIGFQAGINNGFPLSKDWGITSGIRFKQMNASEKVDYGGGGSGGSTGFETSYRYNYVSGNLLAKYRINRHLSITAGPELNFLAGATRKLTNGDKENIKKDAKGFGADIIAGLKYEIPVPNQRSRWGISLLYDRRLSAVSKADVNQHLNASKLSSVQLGVSYFICGCNKKVSEK